MYITLTSESPTLSTEVSEGLYGQRYRRAVPVRRTALRGRTVLHRAFTVEKRPCRTIKADEQAILYGEDEPLLMHGGRAGERRDA